METTLAQHCKAVALRRQQNKLNLAISKNPWGLEVTCGARKGVFFSTSELHILGRLLCAAGKSMAWSDCPELVRNFVMPSATLTWVHPITITITLLVLFASLGCTGPIPLRGLLQCTHCPWGAALLDPAACYLQ